ncbi:hypothetical protein AVEN_270364-1 [Araneus ventricosus]|uniref:Uncharacterized protein n=1 Tax=Araneus ventricosus TaxID=182803 RepID=A0A4Y2MGH3_ARAVE|nr:hypothetical protein AVEN_270364-1 [Araneus ventricosus]
METVGPKYHEEVGIAIQFGFAVGYVTLAGVAWFFRHWFWLQLVISLAFLPFAPAFRPPRIQKTQFGIMPVFQSVNTMTEKNRNQIWMLPCSSTDEIL